MKMKMSKQAQLEGLAKAYNSSKTPRQLKPAILKRFHKLGGSMLTEVDLVSGERW
jgi:hypothetical protein